MAMTQGTQRQQKQFLNEMNAPDAHTKLEEAVATLDPTQLEAYNIVVEWSLQRCAWELAPGSASAPPLELLLLGTAGTRKHTRPNEHRQSTAGLSEI